MGALKEILNTVRAARTPVVSVPALAPAPFPPKAVAVAAPDPAIVKTCHYGVARIPARYRDTWLCLLEQRPCGVTASAWKQAIADTRITFGDWGQLIDQFGWTASAVFDAPGGLIWFLRDDPVVSLGPETAHTHMGRVFDIRGELTTPTDDGAIAKENP